MEQQSADGYLHINSADALDYSLEVAGVGARSYAFVIDWHIRLLAAIVWIYLAAFLFYDSSIFQTMFDEDSANNIAAMVIFGPSFIVYFFYHPVLETIMHGSTPGKRTAGIRLVSLDGHTPGIGSILIRNIFRLIDSLPGLYAVGLIVAMVTKNHVRIGDLAAGTLLVYEDKPDKHSLSDVAQRSLDSKLTAGDFDLLLELLERWSDLDSKQRLHLGHRFLERINDHSTFEKPRQMKQYLQQLSSQ